MSGQLAHLRDGVLLPTAATPGTAAARTTAAAQAAATHATATAAATAAATEAAAAAVGADTRVKSQKNLGGRKAWSVNIRVAGTRRRPTELAVTPAAAHLGVRAVRQRGRGVPAVRAAVEPADVQ